MVGKYSVGCYFVSIPHRCDSNLKDEENEKIIDIKFQSLTGAIQTRKIVFQSYNLSPRFNPSQVRFKLTYPIYKVLGVLLFQSLTGAIQTYQVPQM